ncbi:hypothetical protein [Flavobacterium sp. ASV13]|uniref:hypothetical protein n=1 Tax=Flavobacterium sp. ASV13 TaxID=1506583 RepID=UPI00126815E2|nr:hypothetical protein [Flavobacterium sp. ASV13]
MISLCGSPPAGFLESIELGLVLIIVFLCFTHYVAYKTEYYNEEFVYFSSGKKFMIYMGFLALNFCMLPILILIAFFLFATVFK